MRKLINAVAMASMVAGLGLAQTRTQLQTGDSSRQPMFFQIEDMKWEKITTPRGDCTFELANVRIDPKTKATALMIRHPAKCYVPKHWHTANEMITVIRGTFVLECAGKQGELRPGSTGYVPGQMIHRAWTTPNEDALYLVQVDAAWDVNWVTDTSNPPNVPKHLGKPSQFGSSSGTVGSSECNQKDSCSQQLRRERRSSLHAL